MLRRCVCVLRASSVRLALACGCLLRERPRVAGWEWKALCFFRGRRFQVLPALLLLLLVPRYRAVSSKIATPTPQVPRPAALRLLETSNRLPDRAGESTFLVAEQFSLD